jgi:hypothetical protein
MQKIEDRVLTPEDLQDKIGYHLSKPQLVMDYWWWKVKFLVVLSGKRVGKSGWISYKLIEQSYNKNHTYWVVGRTFDIVDRVWDELEKHAKILGFNIEQKQGRPYRITNPISGSIIEAKSTANGWEHLRGKSVDGVVIDEACLLQKEAYDNDIEPNLMTTGGWCVLISNAPESSANWFMVNYNKAIQYYKKYKELSDEEQKVTACQYAALHFTSYDSPFIPNEVLDRKKAEFIAEGKEDVWSRQYMAAPPSLKGEVFEYGLNDCLADEFFTPSKEFEHGRFVGVLDPARKRDKPVLCIWDKKIKTAVKFYEFDKMPAPDLEKEVIEKLELWGCFKFIIDETGSGLFLLDYFKKALIGKNIMCSGMSLAGGKKNTIIEALKSRIENWSIKFVRDPELLRELEVFTKKELASGIMQYSAPKNDYDDYVDALAIANYEDMTYSYIAINNYSNKQNIVKNATSIIHS